MTTIVKDYEFNPPVARVRDFAIKAHGSQKDKSGLPYITHLDAVAANVVRLFGFDPVLVTVAYLHDVVEDTRVRQSDIDTLFSEKVADAVDSISKRTNEPNYEYITFVIENPIAAKVKLADLLHNADAKRLSALPEYTSRRLRKKYYPAIYRISKSLGISPLISLEEAAQAIRDSAAPLSTTSAALSPTYSISVSSLRYGDVFQFSDNADWHEVYTVSSLTGTPLRKKVVTRGGTEFNLPTSLKVTIDRTHSRDSSVETDLKRYLPDDYMNL